LRIFSQNREKTIKNTPAPREGRWGSWCRWRESNPHGECPTDFESASSTNSNTPAREKKDFIYYIGSAGKKQARSAKKCAVVRSFSKTGDVSFSGGQKKSQYFAFYPFRRNDLLADCT
jgi:hypothetical protein